MPRHRSLTLKRFVTALNDSDPTLLPKYFQHVLKQEQMPPHLSLMYYEYVNNFLETPKNETIKELVYEDFRKINDICEQRTSTLVWASKLFSIERGEKETPQALAMRLFLDHPDAFDYAWGRFCVYGSTSKISRHNIPCEGLEVDTQKLKAFEDEVRQYFSDLAKGQECKVRSYDEGDQVFVLVSRGSYFRTIARWEGGEIRVESFRPASEDVLMYDKKGCQLCIQTPLPKDREQYIRSFTNTIVGQPSLADNPDRDNVYTLSPILDGSFDWHGNEPITCIVPVEARLKLKGATEPVIEIRSKNLRQTLEEDLGGASLSTVELIHVKFRFTIETDGKSEDVTFVVTPPYATDLPKKKHAEVISAYLKENGVQLG